MAGILPIETARLRLRRFTLADAEFIRGLVNEPAFVRFIGDKGVRSLTDAEQYLLRGPMACYEENGFGLYCIELKSDGTSIGMCGLVRRAILEGPDIGYALCQAHWGYGYALEAARATVDEARRLGLSRLLAITDATNVASRRLLAQLGLARRGQLEVASGDWVEVFEMDLSGSQSP
ncbi:MAG: GNAT family N-acetyltransferase [Thermoanaerobaculia bacterium]|nr:GNAT family N-acetyltransferase [Thermoanaerobaculia bacterium]